MTIVWNCVSNSESVWQHLPACELPGFRGCAPRQEGSTQRSAGAGGDFFPPPSLYLKPNPFQIFLYLFFELVALCEHSAKFGGQAVHFIGEGFVVLLFFFYANVADGDEDVILGGDLVCGGNCAEAFYIFEDALLEGGEGVGKAGDVFFGKVTVLAVYHVAHVAGIYEEGFACLLFATGDEPDGYRNCYAVEKLG